MGSHGDAADERSSVKENTEQKQGGLMNRLASLAKPVRLNRSKSTSGQALKGLKFISKADRGAGWTAVEKRFVKITKNTDGLLLRSKFGECIGMNSKDFALVLFDALSRKRNMKGDVIDKKQLVEFWEQISDQNRSKAGFIEKETSWERMLRESEATPTAETLRSVPSVDFSLQKTNSVETT